MKLLFLYMKNNNIFNCKCCNKYLYNNKSNIKNY